MFQGYRWLVSQHPARITIFWLGLAACLLAVSPDLTRLAAEGQARLLPGDAESVQANRVIHKVWPDRWYASAAVAVLERASGLTGEDDDFARKLASRFERPDRPEPIVGVFGPDASPEVAERLKSRDGTMRMVLVPLSISFVAPATQDAVRWLMEQSQKIEPPAGLQLTWTGDAVIGRDYMGDVQTSLDRAAIATVFLLLAVLLFVYRSPLLALIPLVTIGVGLAVSRSVLAWLVVGAGWEMSPLVELFLIVILFGCGTDFCLFLSWRYGEHWDPQAPAQAMRETLHSALEPIATSAGTVIVGLSLMGTTRFKLFSSTGPSVALGLGITLLACLSLTPALLVMLARYRPRSFHRMIRPHGDFWGQVASLVLKRPFECWFATLLLLAPLAYLGTQTNYLQDVISEMPQDRGAVQAFHQIANKFGPGAVAPLSVVIGSSSDLSHSEGLALIDDLSRLLSRQKRLAEVRSATQPLGDPQPLEPARLASRLTEVNEGFTRMAEGAGRLRQGLIEGVAKLQTAIQLRKMTGIDLTGSTEDASRSIASSFAQASAALMGRAVVKPGGTSPTARAAEPAGESTAPKAADPREQMASQLLLAADGAGQIVEGAKRAQEEVTNILTDPVGRHALDRLLITPATVREFPELRKSLQAYISEDGHHARIDITQTDRFFSTAAMNQVTSLRHRVSDFLREQDEVPIAGFGITGANAESADIWAVTRRDQIQIWVIVPLGVFLVLLLALKDPWACVNLVLTMLLSYLFALGMTHLVFVTWLGAEGIDWKVPLFLFVLLVAVGVDYNIFLMSRLQKEVRLLGMEAGIKRAVASTGGLITSAAAITVCSFASFLTSPLASLRQLGFALVVGITLDALLVRPVLVPCGHWLIHQIRLQVRRWNPDADLVNVSVSVQE